MHDECVWCVFSVLNAYNYVFDVDGYVTRKCDHYNTLKGVVTHNCAKYFFWFYKCWYGVNFIKAFDTFTKKTFKGYDGNENKE